MLGPYKDVEQFTFELFVVSFKHADPQVILTEAIRSIQISHWGNIAFEEYFKIENTGPRVSGEWSRVDFDIQHKGQSCLKDLATEYPYYIKGLWISDYIGNISSSNALRSTTKVNLDFRPRFPLCGGWHTDWN